MTAYDFMKLPCCDWEKTVDALDTEDRRQLSDDLAGIMEISAMAEGYVERRYGSGCGDQGHDPAVTQSNRMRVRARKAIGYTYPNAGAVNF